MKIDTFPVQSREIAEVGFVENVIPYNGWKATNILRIKFKDGLVIDYFDVSKEVYKEFLGNGSIGSFWYRKIRFKYKERVNNDQG